MFGGGHDQRHPMESPINHSGDWFDAMLNAGTALTGANPVVDTATMIAAIAAAKAGFHWQENIDSFVNFVTSEPGGPSVGDRYINTVTGVSSGTAQSVTANYIYEWNGVDWTESIPEDGWAVIEDGVTPNLAWVYSGTAWGDFSSMLNHAAMMHLNWAAAGHTMDAALDMNSHQIKEVTLGSAAGDLAPISGTLGNSKIIVTDPSGYLLGLTGETMGTVLMASSLGFPTKTGMVSFAPISKGLPATVLDYREIGKFNTNENCFVMSIRDTIAGTVKFYTVVANADTGSAWWKLNPLYESAYGDANEWDIDINTDHGETFLRVRKTAGAGTNSLEIVILDFTYQHNTFTELSGTGTTTAPTSELCRNIETDGSKLDGIDPGAEVNPTFADSSNTYWVSTAKGNDTTGDGSEGKRLATVQEAIDRIEATTGYGEIIVDDSISESIILFDNAEISIMSVTGHNFYAWLNKITHANLSFVWLNNMGVSEIDCDSKENGTYLEDCSVTNITNGTINSRFWFYHTDLESSAKSALSTVSWKGLFHESQAGKIHTSDGMDMHSKKIEALADGTVATDGMAFGQRYTDAEAVTAMGVKDDSNPLNHDKCICYKVWEQSLPESINATLVFANKIVKAFVTPRATDYKVSFSSEVSHSDSGKGTRVRLGLGQFAVTGVNQGTKTFTIAGDYTSLFIADRLLQIQDSTGNDETYHVVSSALNVTDTDITVAEAIPSAVVDGDIYACIRILVETIDKIENDIDYQGVSGFGIVSLPDAMSKNVYLCFASDTDTKTAYMRSAFIELEEVI